MTKEAELVRIENCGFVNSKAAIVVIWLGRFFLEKIW